MKIRQLNSIDLLTILEKRVKPVEKNKSIIVTGTPKDNNLFQSYLQTAMDSKSAFLPRYYESKKRKKNDKDKKGNKEGN